MFMEQRDSPDSFVEVLRIVLCPIQRLTEMLSPGIPVT